MQNDEVEDQPMYYEGKFEGEWQCEREERILGYKIVVGFLFLLFVAFEFLSMARYSSCLYAPGNLICIKPWWIP